MPLRAWRAALRLPRRGFWYLKCPHLPHGVARHAAALAAESTGQEAAAKQRTHATPGLRQPSKRLAWTHCCRGLRARICH